MDARGDTGIQTATTNSLQCDTRWANLYLSMHFHYIEPVYIGDTITCTVTFDEKDEQKRLFHATASLVNQEGVEVLKSSFSGFPANVRLAR